MSKLGARRVVFSDIDPKAIQNTELNCSKHLEKQDYELALGDLFASIRGKVEFMVFNHPFFSGKPLPEMPVSYGMIAPPELLESFLEDAPSYSNSTVSLVIPFFHLAGTENDPGHKGLKFHYNVSVKEQEIINFGLQEGRVSIYHLTKIR